MIAWWDEDQCGRARSIILLAQSRRGFTNKLCRHEIQREPFLIWIDGPHGHSAEVSDFSHIFLIASGIGIAAQLPIAKEILWAVRKQKIRVQSIHLMWEIESDGMMISHFMQFKSLQSFSKYS